jgi:ribosomal protein S12 methylthiotransferase accessory factor
MLELIRPLAPRAGVTRLANITGLDRIGITTFSAIRPNAETLAVASGKGITEDAARVSALMEAIELFHAEVVEPPTIRAYLEELGGDGVAAELPTWHNAVVNSTAPLTWVPGRDLLQDRQVYVPAELVLLRRTERGLERFVRSSNGLASGCVLPEAILAALFEVVERDAIVCHQLLARRTRRGLPRVRLNTAYRMPLVERVLDLFARASVKPIVYDLTADTNIPVFFVHIYDATDRGRGIFYGSGAHLDPEIALLRALTEAAQSRLVYLAGTRDDYTARQFSVLRLQDTPRLVDELESEPESIDISSVVTQATPTFDSDITIVLERLAAAGSRHVVAVELTLPEFAEVLSVVRLVVPGLHGLDLRGTGASQRAQLAA